MGVLLPNYSCKVTKGVKTIGVAGMPQQILSKLGRCLYLMKVYNAETGDYEKQDVQILIYSPFAFFKCIFF
jgi:hypothetical protein